MMVYLNDMLEEKSFLTYNADVNRRYFEFRIGRNVLLTISKLKY